MQTLLYICAAVTVGAIVTVALFTIGRRSGTGIAPDLLERPRVPLIVDGRTLREPRVRLPNPYGPYIDVPAMIEYHHRQQQLNGRPCKASQR